ncbi:hypothetical protein Pelo_9942 [Pelomyxa schiedti]|nr:hypothetical protein Pelo_9942 [Pelomyxa schiedti]
MHARSATNGWLQCTMSVILTPKYSLQKGVQATSSNPQQQRHQVNPQQSPINLYIAFSKQFRSAPTPKGVTYSASRSSFHTTTRKGRAKAKVRVGGRFGISCPLGWHNARSHSEIWRLYYLLAGTLLQAYFSAFLASILTCER